MTYGKTRVPVGYTGKLKDMDLREGDVVGLGASLRWTCEGPRKLKGKHQYLDDSYFDGGENSHYQNWMLISRADDWSNWHQSRIDGTYATLPNREYETHALPDTEQVMYRWREIPKKEPVVEWVNASVVTSETTNRHFQVKTINGTPQWETIEYVPF